MLNRYWITLAMFLGFLGFSWAGPPPSFKQWDIMGFRPVPKAVEVPDIRFIDESGEDYPYPEAYFVIAVRP